MAKKQKHYIMAAFFLLLLVSFMLIVSTGGLLFGRHKLDVTSMHRYSMNKQSENIVKNLKNPVHITVYMSENISSEYPALNIHAQYILRTLERYKNISPDLLSIEIKNPEPYSPMEKEALSNYIRPFADTSGNNNLYFGAVLSNSEGKTFTIPYFSVQRQNYTEADISRSLAKLSDFKEKDIGIVSFGAEPDSDWLIIQQLGNDYNLKKIAKDVSEIPAYIDILIVINPKQVNNMFLYALDQYVLRGGNLIMLLDSDAKFVDKLQKISPFEKSDLNVFLKNLGIEYNEDIVIGDKKLSYSERKNNTQEKSSILNVNLGPNQINQTSPLTKDLFKVSFRSAGAFKAQKRDNTQYTELFTTDEEGGSVPAVISKFGNPSMALNAFSEDKQKYVLGYMIEGWFDSLFENSLFEGTIMEEETLPFIIASVEKSNIIILSDSDFIYNDALSIRKYQDNAVVYDFIPSSNNADFILRAVDYLAGNHQVIGLEPQYLYDSEYTIGEQLYTQVFRSFRPEYEKTEKRLIFEENGLNNFTNELRSANSSLSISAIKEIEGYNRRIQNLQNELKHLDYRIGKALEEQSDKIIIITTLLFPFVGIIFMWLFIFWLRRRIQNKARSIIK